MNVFTLLGEPVRLRIVDRLAHHEHSVRKLVETVGAEFSVGQPAISRHLRVLLDEKFVEVRAVGRMRMYRLAFDAMDRLDAEVEALWLIWEDRIGWPYDPFSPEPPKRLDRAGRKGLRGRTRQQIEPEEDPYGRAAESWTEEDWEQLRRDVGWDDESRYGARAVEAGDDAPRDDDASGR